jgi:hypothetical protein
MEPATPAPYAGKDNGETRPFGKRDAAARAIGGIQIPFAMLRFIFRKAAWLTPCDDEYLLNRI